MEIESSRALGTFSEACNLKFSQEKSFNLAEEPNSRGSWIAPALVRRNRLDPRNSDCDGPFCGGRRRKPQLEAFGFVELVEQFAVDEMGRRAAQAPRVFGSSRAHGWPQDPALTEEQYDPPHEACKYSNSRSRLGGDPADRNTEGGISHSRPLGAAPPSGSFHSTS